MRKLTATTTIAGLMLGSLLLAGSPARAQSTYDPRIDQREDFQQQRIQQGIESGQLTPWEARRLENEQARIQATEDRMKADGNLSPRERARLTEMQNRAGRDIYRLDHNDRTTAGWGGNEHDGWRDRGRYDHDGWRDADRYDRDRGREGRFDRDGWRDAGRYDRDGRDRGRYDRDGWRDQARYDHDGWRDHRNSGDGGQNWQGYNGRANTGYTGGNSWRGNNGTNTDSGSTTAGYTGGHHWGANNGTGNTSGTTGTTGTNTGTGSTTAGYTGGHHWGGNNGTGNTTGTTGANTGTGSATAGYTGGNNWRGYNGAANASGRTPYQGNTYNPNMQRGQAYQQPQQPMPQGVRSGQMAPWGGGQMPNQAGHAMAAQAPMRPYGNMAPRPMVNRGGANIMRAGANVRMR
jgi:hypothetical protein